MLSSVPQAKKNQYRLHLLLLVRVGLLTLPSIASYADVLRDFKSSYIALELVNNEYNSIEGTVDTSALI